MLNFNLVGVVDQLFMIFRWLIFIRIIFSWIPISYSNKMLYEIREVIFNITELYLRPFRNLIPPLRTQGGYLDLSAIIGIIALEFIRQFVIGLLRSGGF